MRASDILMRGLAAIVVLGCGVYFVFGLAVAAAAHQHGTAIHHDEPVTFSMLWHEASKVPFSAVVSWLRTSGGLWFVTIVGLWFFATLLVAFTLAAHPRLFSRSRKVLGFAGVLLGLGSLFGLLGVFSLLFTFLNALAWRGLDGEWVIELGPVHDAVGILYLAACYLYFGPGSPRSETARRARDCKQDGSATA